MVQPAPTDRPRLPLRLAPIALAVAALASLGACKSKQVPEKISYRVNIAAPVIEGMSGDPQLGAKWQEQTQALAVLEGSRLLRDGEEIATVKFRSNQLRAEFEYPSATRPGALADGSWTLETATLCGTQSLPVKPEVPASADEDERLASGRAVTLDIDLLPPEYDQAELFIDWGTDGETRSLKVGELEIPAGTKSLTVFNRDCPATASVTVDGEEVGTWNSADPVSLISVQPGVCHSFQWIGYGDQGSGKVGVLAEQAVQKIPAAPDGFLEPAPTSISKTSTRHDRSELLRGSCPP